MHILVMTDSWQGALACVQSFGRKGHSVSVVAGDRPTPHGKSQFVKEIVTLAASPDTEKTSRNLIELVDKTGADLVVPISDSDAEIVAHAKEISPAAGCFVIPALKSVEIARSRNRTTRLCREIGIPTPATACLDGQKTIADSVNETGFPLFLKVSGLSGTQGVHLVRSLEQLNTLLERFPKNADLQLQKPVRGDFVGATGFASGGRLLACFSFHISYRHSQHGTPAYATRIEDRRPGEILEKIAAALEWTGGIDLDCLTTEAGEIVLLEINPRFSGTVMFPLKLGLDLPSFYLPPFKETGSDSGAMPATPDANAFISLPEEVFYVSQNPRQRGAEAAAFRKTHSWVDSMYWDDAPLAEAMAKHLLSISWRTLRK